VGRPSSVRDQTKRRALRTSRVRRVGSYRAARAIRVYAATKVIPRVPILASDCAGVLVLGGVGVGFREGGRAGLVLEDVSFDVGAERTVAVVGARWEGKSTLLRLAAGMDVAGDGQVLFDGVDFASRSRRRRARLLGRDIVWLDRKESGLGLTTLDYIGLPLTMGLWRDPRRAQVRRMAAEALDRVGVAHVARKRPQALSSWERVLVGLASAVVVRPKLLVVDDLLDALGTSRTLQAGALLNSLAREFGFGVLFSVSDLDSAIMADRVLVFEQRTLRLMADHQPQEAAVFEFPQTASSGQE
jgi:ABC-type glutathione transport system ATPase component